MMFKPGQKVMCINSNDLGWSKLIKGLIYTIDTCGIINTLDYVTIVETAIGESFFADRFIDATKYLSEKEFNNKFDDWLKKDVANEID